MRKLWLVIKREYLTRVRTKAFIVGTIALPLFSIGILAIQIYTATRQTDHTLKVAVVDDAGGLADAVAKGLNGKLPNGQPAFQVVQTLERPAASELDDLRTQVQNGRLDAFLVVPEGATEGKAGAEFHTTNPGEITITDSIDRAVSDAVIAQRLHDRGVNVQDVGQLVKSVEVKLMKVSAQGETEEKGQTFITAIIVGMILYITLIVYGVTTMRSVIEEKSSRVMEILVASVRPLHLLLGKILGVAAVGLTQYAIWVVLAGLVSAYGVTAAAMFRPGASLPPIHMPWAVLASMMAFFLCGYFLYSSLYAAIGAMCSNDQEAQQLQTPVTLLIVAGFLLFNIILHDPNSTPSVVLSMIPFFAPILMVLRISMQTPPLWQIALSIAISILTTAGIVYFSARVYRVGVLMYGKRPSLVELARWLKYT
ncbi:MAG TPA: ABC transporter permease [Terriglobia bacterium]